MASSAFRPRPGGFPNGRVLAAGVVAGAAVAWALSRNRPPATNVGEAPKMVDWERVRSLAISMNRGAAMTAPERAALTERYRALAKTCEPIVAAYTGDTLPPGADRTFAFDRVDWINANIDGFARMFAPLEALNPALGKETTPGSMLMGGVNQTVASTEVGLLLGYLARRVLGQYDLSLLGREPLEAGKLYYVEPNIRTIETQLGLPGDDFRTWLALHEITHAFEFEAHPWLREHMNGLLDRYFVLLQQDAERLRKDGLKGLGAFVGRARGGGGDGGWISALMTPEQKAIFAEMQATMCVVEGYSNHVMNAVGRDLLPTYELIARRFAQRQLQKSPAEQLFARLTGLTVKLEQYRLGEAFIDRIAAERGHATAKRVWDGPEFLPDMDEIRNPERWIARIDARDRAAERRAGEAAAT
jgi:coenzyme F420 biosynthesis associated uncharacterized protein